MSDERPFNLVAELTHRCPLRCPYCSNPIELQRANEELPSVEWLRVFAEAEALGVVQVHLTGGEPLVRDDLEALVAGAHRLGLYVNLITSGLPLERARLAALCDAGLDHVQLSFQDAEPSSADRIAGTPSHAHKRVVAVWVKELGLPLTVNAVLHRLNIDGTDALVQMAEELAADRLELAPVQVHGWALDNRAALLPARDQIERARAVAQEARTRLAGRVQVTFVLPDYYADRPRACMDGWGRRTLVVAPSGLVLPCHGAYSLRGLDLPSVRREALGAIWREAPIFQRFRGEAWMPEPCRSCDRRATDFGGCRCQAFALTGDASATDPVCALSPHHQVVEAARLAAGAGEDPPLVYRGRAAGLRLSGSSR